jgi:alanyl aminopeptidase
VIHPIASSSEIEPAFDALAYDKGAAVLAMFERFAGPEAFQAAVRRYLADHGGTSVTSQAFLDALAAATRPEVAAALASNLAHLGTPVVELALACDPAAAGGAAPQAITATITAAVAGGVTVPVCVRYPSAGGAARSCVLAGAHTEQVLPPGSGCPAWLVGNAGGAGYYRTAWRGPATRAPVSELSPIERLVRGDDAALAVRLGELPAAGALAEIAALAASRDPDAALAALQIAGELDAFADDAVRPAWTAWLARRFADRLTRPALLEIRRPANDALVAAVLLPLVRAALDPAVVAAARAELERYADPASRVWLLRIAAAREAGPLFDRLVRVAAAHDGDARDADLAAMGELPAPLAPRVVDTALDRRFSAEAVWPALAAMLGRSETRSEAWRAIHARFAALIAALGSTGSRAVLEAAAALCDQRARDELAADARDAELAATFAGSTQLAGTLATIDRCLVRRAASGDLAAALASAPGP